MFTRSLARRVARRGAQPLLTYYSAADGARTELSAVTFANWVDKTANLIVDLGHEDGDPIDVALGEAHPAHWVTLVWIAAAWQRGCPVNLGVTGAGLLVVGPGDERRADLTVACSLHPLGLGFRPPVPGVVDYAEVFVQPDAHDEASSPLNVPGDVAARDTRLLLSDPTPGWEAVAQALVAPVLGDGSTVVAVGYDAAGLDALAVSERATA
ncbi:MAG TPA: TIGR03089 family protein [Arachnia sp.]|nr:TIGR03089 family protein [Arachnia sp.]